MTRRQYDLAVNIVSFAIALIMFAGDLIFGIEPRIYALAIVVGFIIAILASLCEDVYSSPQPNLKQTIIPYLFLLVLLGFAFSIEARNFSHDHFYWCGVILFALIRSLFSVVLALSIGVSIVKYLRQRKRLPR
jgi:hypothetical protein